MLSTVILDWDGTTFLELQPLEHTHRLVHALRDQGHRIIFVTNNSSRATLVYRDILDRNGLLFEGISVVTSNLVAIQYLKETLQIRSAFVMGNSSFKRELAEAGIIHAPSPQAVVVAFDTSLTYSTLQEAHSLILRGLPFLATHSDPVCPGQTGSLLDCGSLLAALECSTGKKPIVLGKPGLQMCLFLQKNCLQSPSRIIVVGDRQETDGRLAEQLGARFLLVDDAHFRTQGDSLLEEILTLMET